MMRPVLVLLAAALAPLLGAADDEKAIRGLISKHCYACHSTAKHKGDIDLEGLRTPGTDPAHDQIWDNARLALTDHVMPPPEKPQPSLDDRDRMAAWIDRALDGPDGDVPTDPGWGPVRRLTRNEFNRTVRDLLGVEGTPADAFPADNTGGSGSFDNNADGLFVSPLMMESLLEVSLSLIEQAKPERLGLVAPEKNKAGVETPQTRRKAVELSLAGFLPRAWRRPVTSADVQGLVRLYEKTAKRNNVTHEDALRLAYAAALTSPNFIFRIEAAKPGTAPYPVGPYELASRLSYFLWSTMPDEALLAAAADGSLAKPEVLAAQARRLLADERAGIFVSQFIGQWLGTHELATGRGPDPKQFPGYGDSLRAAMAEEPVAFLRALLAGNGSLLDLIDCEYVHVNGELARHYGLPSPGGDGFGRVAVRDGRRGGLVTMAGVLAITSRPSRTSPVLRGKWILDDLLSAPPPPPPPNVPPLPEDGGPNLGTLRQRLERHRADPACNSCHQRIDPLGFGLENFDALGRWRNRGDHAEELDTVGTLPSGETFDGPQQLKKILMQRKDRVIATVVERMLAYALGRGLERADRPTVRHIVARLAADGYKAQTLVDEIVLSVPFRLKRNPPVGAPTAATATSSATPAANKDPAP